ncbi:MAG: hypothetical protein WBM32_05980, partial [Crocosphaera sp.]
SLYYLSHHGIKADHLVNLSSILTLLSFTVRDILFLRLLAIGAQLTFIPYCLMQSPPLWTPVIWNVLFLMVNIVNLIILLLERRPVKFSSDEEKLYKLAFNSLTPREFLKLLACGEWREGKAEEILILPRTISPRVSILCQGEAVATLEGKELSKIPEGKLLGVSSIFAGSPMPIGIKFITVSRYISWPIEPLQKNLDKQPELRAKLRSIVSQDLAKSVNFLEEFQVKEWQKNHKNIETQE